MTNNIDNVMTDKYNVRQFGIVFTGAVRWFASRQHEFFYCKKCWLDKPKSKASSDQMYFDYSTN
jgi:hypothetical protein